MRKSATILAVATAATSLLIPAVSAQASPLTATSGSVHPEWYRCDQGSTEEWCAGILRPTALFAPNGQWLANLQGGDGVTVTCWFLGQTYDGYFDHVISTTRTGPVSGHVDDDNVDFGGGTPPDLGIPECGSQM